jgi:Trk-type K+ transport system membrane component
MAALMRLLIFGGIALAVLYLGLSWYFRAAHRKRMARDWEAAGRPGNREAYVAEGMAQYARSLRRRLLWLVFILPVAAVILLIWLTNFN